MQIVMAMYLLICFITYDHKMILWDFLEEKIWMSSIGRCATLGYTAVIVNINIQIEFEKSLATYINLSPTKT